MVELLTIVSGLPNLIFVVVKVKLHTHTRLTALFPGLPE